MKTLDPRDYRFTPFNNNGPFAFLKMANLTSGPTEDVKFDHYLLTETYYDPNEVSFRFYGTCSVSQQAAILLSNGDVLFCVVHGSAFAGTFDTNENINMQYYLATPIG
jgi:hypothetical protein